MGEAGSCTGGGVPVPPDFPVGVLLPACLEAVEGGGLVVERKSKACNMTT